MMALVLLSRQEKVIRRIVVYPMIVAQSLFSENIEEKERETIQKLHDVEDQRWKPLEPLSSTDWSTNENSYDDEEHNDRRAEISHEEEATSDTHEGAQSHENPSEGAEEVHNQAVEETGEDPQEPLEESYHEVYDGEYEVNPENSDTSEQVLSALPDVPQTMAKNHNASSPRLSEQGSHEASPLHLDLEYNVISLELLEADSTNNGSVERAPNESYRVTTDLQLSKTVGENLNEGGFHEQNFEHCRFFSWGGRKIIPF